MGNRKTGVTISPPPSIGTRVLLPLSGLDGIDGRVSVRWGQSHWIDGVRVIDLWIQGNITEHSCALWNVDSRHVTHYDLRGDQDFCRPCHPRSLCHREGKAPSIRYCQARCAQA